MGPLEYALALAAQKGIAMAVADKASTANIVAFVKRGRDDHPGRVAGGGPPVHRPQVCPPTGPVEPTAHQVDLARRLASQMGFVLPERVLRSAVLLSGWMVWRDDQDERLIQIDARQDGALRWTRPNL